MPPSAPRELPCVRRNTAAGKPRPGASWRKRCGPWPAAWQPLGSSAAITSSSWVITAPAYRLSCWLHRRWVLCRCRSTKMPLQPTMSSPSPMLKSALLWWKTKNRSTRCWKCASKCRRSPAFGLTTSGACVNTMSRALPPWMRWSKRAAPMTKPTPASMTPKWPNASPAMWRRCFSPRAPRATLRAWCTPTAHCWTAQ